MEDQQHLQAIENQFKNELTIQKVLFMRYLIGFTKSFEKCQMKFHCGEMLSKTFRTNIYI